MMDTRDVSLPTPAIVVAVGGFARAAADQVRNIYLRSDPRRKHVTAFWTLAEAEKGDLQLADLAAAPSAVRHAPGDRQPAHLVRRSVFERTVKSAETLKARLQQGLHNIRAQEPLMEAGWLAKYDVPLNLYLLADVKDPSAAGAVLPLACLLADVAGESNLCCVHTLLNTAVFPRAPGQPRTDEDLEVYTFLVELDELLRDKSKNRAKLAEVVDCAGARAVAMAVYLFDCHKEGSYLVRDNGQMQVMVGNALLALLQSDMARRVQDTHAASEDLDEHGFYSSIGAVALVYDPASLQQACAGRAAREFADTQILADCSDAQIAARQSAMVRGKLGDLRGWMERCFTELPLAIGQVRLEANSDELAVLLADLTLEPIDHDQLRELPWARQLRDYGDHFEQETRPAASAVLSSNAQQLGTDLTGILAQAIDSLPTNPELYPGGIKNAQRTLTFLAQHLAQEKDRADKLLASLQQKQKSRARDLESKLKRMQEIIDGAPKLRWCIRTLPGFLRKWVAPFSNSRRYGRQLVQLRTLKEQSIELLQCQCAAQLQEQALGLILTVMPRLGQTLEQGKTDYQNLQANIAAEAQQLPVAWPEMPLGQSENGWDRVFRVAVVDKSVADWAFAKWHPPADTWNFQFFAEHSSFRQWHTTSAAVLVQWLVVEAAKAYAALWEMSIDDVLALWVDQPRGFVGGKPIAPGLIATAIASAFPLLKPDFDAVGGAGSSPVTAHGLLGDPEWKQLRVLPALLQDTILEVVPTGDPFAALLLQIRHSVPLQTLVEMIESGKIAFDSLPPADQQQYGIIHSPSDVIQPVLPQEVDKANPDIVHKTFQWQFAPKGSKGEVEQAITVDISRQRFQHYRRQPRLSGEYNCYAEEEMPEIRALASEFQKLHAGQKWSTYNQALNVLTFVQSCIRYGYDQDTTGYRDWARYPIETLLDGTGDCEDVAILCAAILARLGFTTVLLVYPTHVAFGVAGADKLKGQYLVDPRNGNHYFYGEATGTGWHLGEIPKKYAGSAPEQILDVHLLLADE